MRRTVRAVALPALVALLPAACATKGHVRDALAEQRSQLEASIAQERSERAAADERLAADLASLRADLQAMRTEFDAEIEAVYRLTRQVAQAATGLW